MPNACGACWRSSGDEINVKMVALKTASGFLGQCSKFGGQYLWFIGVVFQGIASCMEDCNITLTIGYLRP